MRFFAVVLAALAVAGAAAETTVSHHDHTHGHDVTHAHDHHTGVTHAHTGHHDHVTPTHSPNHNDEHHLAHQVLSVLVMRGENIIHRAERQIAELEKLGHGHLLYTMKNEVALAEQLTTELRHDLAEKKPVDIHRLHAVEEMLLHIENRLAEELAAIEEIKAHPEKHIPVDKLIENGEHLAKQAQEVLKEYGEKSQSRVAAAIHNELHGLTEFIEMLKKHPKGTELLKESMQLARHEISMHALLVKAREELHKQHHGNHDHHEHHDHHHQH